LEEFFVNEKMMMRSECAEDEKILKIILGNLKYIVQVRKFLNSREK
jgi:hypothetical protein